MTDLRKILFEKALQKAIEDVKSENPLAGGWETIEDMARMRFRLEPTDYILNALIDYLEDKETEHLEKEIELIKKKK